LKRPPTPSPENGNPGAGAQTAAPDRLLRHTTLRQLQVFDQIVRQGSFTAAAQALHLTQPTVSAQMRKLAETLDTPLFEQDGRLVQTTPAGLALHEACREIFEALSRLDMTVADLKGLRRGRLRLAVVTTAKHFAPEVLGAFCRKHPGIDVSLKVSNRERILERMHARGSRLMQKVNTPCFGHLLHGALGIEAQVLGIAHIGVRRLAVGEP
jgi:LysR family transcriptional regulator, low CO2-responsive transcriptional regulator